MKNECHEDQTDAPEVQHTCADHQAEHARRRMPAILIWVVSGVGFLMGLAYHFFGGIK